MSAASTGSRKIISATQLRLIIGFCFALAALVAQTFSGAFVQELVADAAILSIFALSLDFLARSGLVSFGHAGFFGLGAYAFGGTAVLLELPAWSGMLLAIAGGVIAGILVGSFVVRTSGAFFIMVTLAMAEMFYSFVFRSPLFNGADGMGGVPRLDATMFGFTLEDPSTFALAMMVLCFVIWLVLELVSASPFGRVLDAIRQNDGRVAALGGRVFYYRLAAFAASGGIGALAGALKAQHTNFLSPDLASWFLSGDVLIAVVIGGIGTLIGGIIGSTLLVFLKEVLSSHVGHWYLMLGAIFVAVALLLPKGIVGTVLAIRERKQADLDAAARPADKDERP